jgi:hypothetical protein
VPKTKEQKREEAAERQAAYNQLSAEEKLVLLLGRRGKSNKVATRLKAQLSKQVEDAQKPAVELKRQKRGRHVAVTDIVDNREAVVEAFKPFLK